MNENNGWPGKPGVPLNPELDGWHWVKTEHGLAPWRWKENPESIMWESGWEAGDGVISPAYFAALGPCTYLGPCLTPDEAAALQKKGCVRDQKTTQYCADVVDRDKRIAELEAALKPLSCSCTGFCGVMGWLPADNDACARRQGRAALKGKKDE